MRKEYESMWIAVDSLGNPLLQTLRKDRISALKKGKRVLEVSDWKEAKNAGWSLVNVKVTIEAIPEGKDSKQTSTMFIAGDLPSLNKIANGEYNN